MCIRDRWEKCYTHDVLLDVRFRLHDVYEYVRGSGNPESKCSKVRYYPSANVITKMSSSNIVTLKIRLYFCSLVCRPMCLISEKSDLDITWQLQK